jgi:hypothetical protein
MVYANMKCDIEHKKPQQIAKIHNKLQEINTKQWSKYYVWKDMWQL